MKFQIVLKLQIKGGGIIKVPAQEFCEAENFDTLLSQLAVKIPFDQQFEASGMRKVGIDIDEVPEAAAVSP